MKWKPGTWRRWIFGTREQLWAVVVCPQCGAGMSIGGGAVFGSCHSIGADGSVSPSVVCYRCSWHTFIRLIGWPIDADGEILMKRYFLIFSLLLVASCASAPVKPVPPPVSAEGVGITLTTPTGEDPQGELGTATVTVGATTCAPREQTAVGWAFWCYPVAAGARAIHVETDPSFQPVADQVVAVLTGNNEFEIEVIPVPPPAPVRPAAIARGPLPVLPVCASCPSPHAYDQVLTWRPPPGGCEYMRADAWGVEIPGLPFVKGGSSEHPERALTWFLDRWAPEWQDRILSDHAKRAYKHFVLSWPDSRDGNGQSIEQFVGTAKKVKAWGFCTSIFIGSKLYDPRDQTPEQWGARVDPVLDALIAAHAIDEVMPCWECDSFNVAGAPLIAYVKHVGQKVHPAGVTVWLHFYSEHTSWFADGDPRGRFGFYDDLGSDVDGLLYQADPAWDIGQIQARLVDTLDQFARRGNQHRLRLFEWDGATKFSGDKPNEDDSNLIGFLAMCTEGPAHVWGFGGGARLPSGEPIP